VRKEAIAAAQTQTKKDLQPGLTASENQGTQAWRLESERLEEERSRKVEANLAIFNDPSRPLADREESLFILTTTLQHKNFRNVHLTNAVFSGIDLNGLDFTGATLERPVFVGLTLNKIVFSGVSMNGPDFSNARLDNVDFSGAILSQPNFKGASLSFVTLKNATLLAMTNPPANVGNSDWSGAVLVSNVFGNLNNDYLPAHMGYVNLQNVKATNTVFRGMYLYQIDLQRAQLDRVQFQKCDFSSDLSFQGASLKDVVFEDVAFNGTDFSGATFRGDPRLVSLTWWRARGWPRQLVEKMRTNSPPVTYTNDSVWSRQMDAFLERLNKVNAPSLKAQILVERAKYRAALGIELNSALADITGALQIDPRNISAIETQTYVLLQLGKIQEAAAAAEKLPGDDEYAEFFRGVILEREQRLVEAAIHFQHCSKLRFASSHQLINLDPQGWWPADAAVFK
jgi:uncharacterized protein YjbI with pentapeptide repeats